MGFFNFTLMKYSKWIGTAACVLLIVTCFIPWTYHDDVHKNFTGFYSQNNTYGKPGNFFVFFSLLSLVLILLRKVWAQRMLLFVSGVMLAYAIKTYILYTSCYNAYCPDKKAGIILMLSLSVIIFVVSLFPDIDINTKEKKS